MDAHKTHVNPLFLREEELREGMELLFFAVNDFNAELDPILSAHGLGRAHFRALYFIGRDPGLSVGDLIGVLNVTKQSISRVLRDLIDLGYLRQEQSRDDRRRRRLYLTDTGTGLERHLSQTQRRRLALAYKAAGAEAVEGFRTVLSGLRNLRGGGG